VDFIGILSNHLQLDVFSIIPSHSTSLFLVYFNHIILLHFKGLGCLIIINPSSIEEKPKRSNWNPDPLTVALFEFTHLRCLLHSEVDFIGILSNHLQLDVFSIIPSHSTSLFLVNFYHIILLHFKGLGCLIIIDPSSIKQKPERCDWNANSFTVAFFQFPHLCCLLHSKVDLIGILTHHLQLDVLSLRIVSTHVSL